MADNKILNSLCLSVILLGCFFTAGCRVLSNTRQILVLRDVSESQSQIKKYLNRQEKLFYKLVKDIKAGRLKTGEKYSRVVEQYGDPVFCREGKNYSEKCLFRKPTDYFSSDKVYLYFTAQGKLAKIEYIPVSTALRLKSHKTGRKRKEKRREKE